MKKRITVISFLVSALVLMLGVGLLMRGGDEKRPPDYSDTGVSDVDDIELSPESLLF